MKRKIGDKFIYNMNSPFAKQIYQDILDIHNDPDKSVVVDPVPYISQKLFRIEVVPGFCSNMSRW